MELILIRHLKTPGNEKRQYIGSTDEELSEQEVLNFKQKYKIDSYPQVQQVIVSPMKRCIQTAELIYPKNQITQEVLLKECDFGIFEGQPEYLHPKTSVVGHFGDHYAQFGGESQDQFVARVVASAKEIVDKHPDQSILAVSHAGALMTFLHAVEPERVFESCPGNCAILVFDYDGLSFHFVKLIDPIADQELVEF